MTEVTARMHIYRECVRHIWNTQFLASDPRPDWDLRDQFCDAALILFQALVLRGLDVDDAEVLADYRSDQAPLMFLRLEVEPGSTILVNRTGAGPYWDDPVSHIESGDCDLRFIQFFDWSDLDFRDFAFYRVRVVGSSRYPHLVRRDALLPVASSVKVFCEGAAQQVTATDERLESDGSVRKDGGALGPERHAVGRLGEHAAMTKMDMVWAAVASMLHPNTSSSRTVTRSEIEATVAKLFGASLTAVMIERHLVSSVDRMADKEQPQRGGSRNRYLFRTSDGNTPSREGLFRLYKQADAKHDGWEKTGPTHPGALAIPTEYRHLVEWYTGEYANSA